MKTHSRRIRSMAGPLLAAGLALVAVQAPPPALAQTDVRSLPGDRGVGHEPWTEWASVVMGGGSTGVFEGIELPSSAEAVIETITVWADLPLGQAPFVRLKSQRESGLAIEYNVALTRQGTYTQQGVARASWTATLPVRLRVHEQLQVNAYRVGGSTGTFGVQVTLSGYAPRGEVPVP